MPQDAFMAYVSLHTRTLLTSDHQFFSVPDQGAPRAYFWSHKFASLNRLATTPGEAEEDVCQPVPMQQVR